MNLFQAVTIQYADFVVLYGNSYLDLEGNPPAADKAPSCDYNAKFKMTG
jgi:hypothetical protein